MDKKIDINELIKKLNDFEWEYMGNSSETQNKAKITEKQIKKVFYDYFGNNIIIYKNGSQQHPDFYILNKQVIINKFNSIENFEIKKPKKSISFKAIIDKNFEENQILKVEVKSFNKNIITYNDSLPNPNYDKSILYIFFDFSPENNDNKNIFMSTSYWMAKKSNKNIEKKLKKSKSYIKRFQEIQNKIWEKTNITSKIRPTYRSNVQYVRPKEEEEIEECLKEVKKLIEWRLLWKK